MNGGNAAFCFLGFVRIKQPHQLMLCRQTPVRISALTILLAVGLGVRPVNIITVVPRRPHQGCLGIQNRPVVIGNETVITADLFGLLYAKGKTRAPDQYK